MNRSKGLGLTKFHGAGVRYVELKKMDRSASRNEIIS